MPNADLTLNELHIALRFGLVFPRFPKELHDAHLLLCSRERILESTTEGDHFRSISPLDFTRELHEVRNVLFDGLYVRRLRS